MKRALSLKSPFCWYSPRVARPFKLQDSDINVSRAWITKLMPAAVSLVEPIFNAQLESVRRSGTSPFFVCGKSHKRVLKTSVSCHALHKIYTRFTHLSSYG
jgi:hypothetical protein